MSSIFEEVYTNSGQHGQIEIGQVILALGVFTAATHSCVSADSERGLFASAYVVGNSASGTEDEAGQIAHVVQGQTSI